MRASRFFSLRIKILAAMALVAAVVVTALVATNQALRRRQLLGEFQAFARGVAGTTAIAVDGSLLEGIHSDADAAGPDFQKVRGILDAARKVNGLLESEIYILRPEVAAKGSAEEVGVMSFVVMLQKKPFVGHRYVVPAVNRTVLRQTWESDGLGTTGIYTDANGTYISGYAAVRDSSGRSVGILEVDVEISRFIRHLRAELWMSVGIGLAGFAVAMVPGLLLARGITQGLAALSHTVRQFKSGDHGVEAQANTSDEVGELGGVFNEMLFSLREKLALLPYVSRFTAEAVRKSQADPGWLAGSEQEVMVLFADLRGFTAFSESRAASEIVRELNGLLSAQADVVLSAGGDVDKFIGDAVMAVFLGSESSAATVWECARRMIERVREETEKRGWKLALGVGIHAGRAVVGSIGSEIRRDFTAVGHTVNVASRFCDHAGHWEVMTSDAFYRMLPEELQAGFRETEPIHFKNVSGKLRTWLWRAE